MKRILTEVTEVYAVFNRRVSDGTVTLMWIDTSRQEAEKDCERNQDAEYDWFFTGEKIYGALWNETWE